MGSPTAPLDLTLEWITKVKFKVPQIWSLYLIKEPSKENMLPLNINRIPYMGNPTTPLYLTLSDHDKSISWMSRVRHMFLLNSNRNSHMGNLNAPSGWAWKVEFNATLISSDYIWERSRAWAWFDDVQVAFLVLFVVMNRVYFADCTGVFLTFF